VAEACEKIAVGIRRGQPEKMFSPQRPGGILWGDGRACRDRRLRAAIRSGSVKSPWNSIMDEDRNHTRKVERVHHLLMPSRVLRALCHQGTAGILRNAG